jgi:hypothetical protein
MKSLTLFSRALKSKTNEPVIYKRELLMTN